MLEGKTEGSTMKYYNKVGNFRDQSELIIIRWRPEDAQELAR